MSQVWILLNVYYEMLYERLVKNRELCVSRLEELLNEELAKGGYGPLRSDKFAAYLDACEAFIDERLEMYNPIGIQYLYDKGSAEDAFELEMELSWYDSRAEFQSLVEAVRKKLKSPVNDLAIQAYANELILEVGAYPDKSIISGYETSPGLNKLPDYIVARVIEEIIKK
ncbi:MAG: hypothetical protein JW860_06785 [Sedimentisphaerales bacterium]|nr:hypothetical protein [Sedimentisphaerales bacterium]